MITRIDASIRKNIMFNTRIPTVRAVSSYLFGRIHHSYLITVQSEFGVWHVARRYSEFRELYTHIKYAHPELDLPEFPAKSLWGSRSDTVVEQRRHDFEYLLSALI